MFMKKIIFLFATIILLTSCVFDRVFSFRFYNHSSCDVSLILDLNPYDGIITPGSGTDFVLALNWVYIDNYDKRWDKLVKDSMHIYVLDAEVMKLRPGDILSKEVIDKIDPDMILTRMTVTHNDLDNGRVDYWPQDHISKRLLKNKQTFWTGSPKVPTPSEAIRLPLKDDGPKIESGELPKPKDISGLEYDLAPNPDGGNCTLYRGITGSENSEGPLFMTDDVSYAASYSTNGEVVKVTLPKETIDKMMYNYDLTLNRGMYISSPEYFKGTSYVEYVFSTR